MQDILPSVITLLGVVLGIVLAMRLLIIILRAIRQALDPEVSEALRCQKILKKQFALKTYAEFSQSANATILMCDAGAGLEARIGPIRVALDRPDAVANQHLEYAAETIELPWKGGTRKRSKNADPKIQASPGLARSPA